MVTVACCQLAPAVGELEKNLATVSRAIASASSAGADVIVLPELVTSGYCLASREEAASVSIRFDHPVFRQWSGDAGGAVLVLGFAEAGDAGCLYNSAALVDGRGLRAVYRKAHLWDAEHKFFTPGSAPPPVIDTAVGRIAMMICYDLEFPEMTRSVALAGADLLAVPTNWPWTERPDGWPAPEIVIAMAAARVNRLPIACCDRSGTERGQRWNQASIIVGPDGWPLATAGQSGPAIAQLDMAAGRDKALSPRNHALTDRRPDLY